jgi:hypothetical protein
MDWRTMVPWPVPLKVHKESEGPVQGDRTTPRCPLDVVACVSWTGSNQHLFLSLSAILLALACSLARAGRQVLVEQQCPRRKSVTVILLYEI